MGDPYRRFARFYDKVVDPPNAALRKIGLKLSAATEGTKVLEVGCGTGSNLKLYEERGCDIYGIDLSPSMLERARGKLGADASLHLGDASDMPYDDGAFDIVTAMFTLHEMPPAIRKPVLDEMVRVTDPDGKIVLIDYHFGRVGFPKGWVFKSLIVTIERIAGREHFRNYRDFRSRDGLPGLVGSQDLTLEKERVLGSGNILAYVIRPG
jgi:ubiquinone/menaquinone biosynthesis C-methylase UbiE